MIRNMRGPWGDVTADLTDVRVFGSGQRNKIFGTTGDDRLRGTDGRDNFYTGSGDDTVRGLGGRDRLFFREDFDAADYVNGGAGSDKLILEGNYPDLLELASDRIISVDALFLRGYYEHIIIDDGFGDLKIDSELGNINLDASMLTTGSVHVSARNGDDTIVGTRNNDYMYGSSGSDTLTGGLGADRFVYKSTVDSLEDGFSHPDLITDFTNGDTILLFQTSDTLSYHIGATAAHAGDVIASYDSSQDQTMLLVFTDTDDEADLVILLSAEHLDLMILKDIHVILN